MTFFACALFAYLPQYSNGTYLPYLFTEVMGDPSVIGTFTGIRAFMEVPGMLLAAVLCRKLKLRTITLAVFAYYGMEQLVYASAYSGTVLIAMMLTSGMAYGFYLFAIVRYVYSLAPRNLSATAMTANAAIMAMSGIGGNFLGGMMVDTVGIRPFYVLMGILILAATAVYLGTLILGKRLGIAQPTEQ
jgi:MFS family permease